MLGEGGGVSRKRLGPRTVPEEISIFREGIKGRRLQG